MDPFEILEKLGQKYKHSICKIYIFGVCVCVLIFVRLSCCQSAVSGCLSRRKYLWKTWMTKTRWGFCASMCGGELMQRHYPFVFVLVFPTLCKERIGEGEGLLEKNTRQWQSHSHRQLNHNSIIVKKLFLRLLCSGSERGLLMNCESWAQKNPLFPSVTEVWIVSVWRFELLPSYAAPGRNATTLELLK